MTDLSTMTESELREYQVPWPKSMAELGAIIEQLTERQHDYGTCVYAMSIASVATFYYVSHCLGVTGFQASCADMDILTRTRSMKGPWSIQNHANLLYPQYANAEHYPSVEEVLVQHADWFREQATKLLAERHEHTHPDVLAWWKRLAALPHTVKL